VYGITAIGDEVFTVRENSQQIDVHDATTLAPKRSVSVPQLGPLSYGLTGTAAERCLFVSDFYSNLIHRVELDAEGVNGNGGDSGSGSWTAARWPAGLSMTKAGNVLAVSYGELLLQEFTTHGALVRQVNHIEYQILDASGQKGTQSDTFSRGLSRLIFRPGLPRFAPIGHVLS